MTQESIEADKRTQRHIVMLCHPDERSFNAAVAHAYCEAVRSLGHEAILRDLYRIGFDPVLRAGERPSLGRGVSDDVANELEHIRGGDIFVLVYPIWFGTAPAMMKGYVERVLGAGFSYRAIQAGEPHPMLGGRHLLSITSSGATVTWLDLRSAWTSLREVFDNYLVKAFSMASSDHLHLESVIEDMDQSLAREKLHRVESFAADTCARLSLAARTAGAGKAPTPA
jgi:NAD(P)H dehydrogenase (quinone)